MPRAWKRCHHSRVTGRAVSFGAVASAYEKYRPGYPEELVDEVLVYTGRPVRTALEIGAGTGKATRVFAGRGIAVTATDPDAAMLTELRKHVPSTVGTVHGAFEELPLTSTYDLVFAAASLHWTEQAGRWSRVATLLNPDGVFASFGGQMCLADMAVEKAVHSARAEFLADDGVPSPDGTPEDSQMQWPDRTGCVQPVHRRTAVDHRGPDDYVCARLHQPPFDHLRVSRAARVGPGNRVRSDP